MLAEADDLGRTDTVKNEAEKAPIRMGIIGFGVIGRHHLRGVLTNGRLRAAAIAEPGDADTKMLPGDTAFFRRWEELLELPNLDAVSVCVPHYLHAPITLGALAAGKHVLVEKPLALSVEEGKTLLRAARESGRVLMVELTHRFYPALQQARAFVEEGHLGEIYAVEDRIVETAGARIQPWLKSKALAGGGVALTNGVHMIDRIAAVTGQALRFEGGRAGYGGKLGDVEDTAAMLFSLENGAPVQLLASWPAGSSGVDDELTIYGTKGTLRVRAWQGWRFESLNAAERGRDVRCYAPAEGMAARIQSGVASALREFASAIDEHRPPAPAPEAALEAQRLIEEFYLHIGGQAHISGAAA